jgi:hypothetical protein
MNAIKLTGATSRPHWCEPPLLRNPLAANLPWDHGHHGGTEPGLNEKTTGSV